MSNSIIPPGKERYITDIPGYTPNISRLVGMMNYTRLVTLRSVDGLTAGQLDFLFDKKSNSIGALLLHMAAGDFYMQKLTFEERQLTDEEFKEWEAPLSLGDLGREEIKGNDLNYYIKILDENRSKTYELLKEKDDEWLEMKVPNVKQDINNYFIWFHLFEDEINHRGQINWLKKRMI